MYVQLAAELERRILAGTYAPNTAIPSETELRAEFSVGRTTVRAAVKLLADKGLVIAAQGKGVYVLPPDAE